MFSTAGFFATLPNGFVFVPFVRGLRSIAIHPLGYWEEANNRLVNLKWVRRPQAESVAEV